MIEVDKDEVERIIWDVLAEFPAAVPAEPRAASLDNVVLFGEGGALDSIELVSFVVALEQALGAAAGGSVSLVDEKAMSQQRSPFRTGGTLRDYITVMLAGEQA